MKSNVNFHIHTTRSDGGKTVAEVVEDLCKAGVGYFAVTDHDTVEGNPEAAKLALEYGLKHFNGIELSCCFADGEIGLDESWVCHIVGLGFNLEKMRVKLKQIEEEKDKRLRELFDLLVADGYNIELKRVTMSGKIPARKTISKELINKGYAANGDECYEKILNTDRYRKYAKAKPAISEGIQIVHDCDGLAIWAHPFGVSRGGKKELAEEQVRTLAKSMSFYNIDGLEVYYHKYTKEQILFLEELWRMMHGADIQVFKSIGTDYHMSPFDEDPEYIKLREKESLVFEVDGVTPDESIVSRFTGRSQRND